MYRSYDHFSETDRRTIRKWQLRVIVSYLAGFVMLLAVVIASHQVADWTGRATQAEIASSHSTPTPAAISVTRR
jgi:hypothetical protein